MKKYTIILVLILTILFSSSTVMAEDSPACDGLLKALEKIPPNSTGYAKVLEIAQNLCGEVIDNTALVALYYSTDGDNWKLKINWLDETVHHCQWSDVRCNEQNQVIGLGLGENYLSGFIPPELGNLANLQALYLDENQLVGPIPPQLGNLTRLEIITLFENQLSGSIPPELGNLTNLRYLFLGTNNLVGSIPPDLSKLSNLTSLSMNNNQLTGCIPWELSKLQNMRYLNLQNNPLDGWETQAALDWALSLDWYQGPDFVGDSCP